MSAPQVGEERVIFHMTRVRDEVSQVRQVKIQGMVVVNTE